MHDECSCCCCAADGCVVAAVAVLVLQVASPHPPNFCILVLSHAVTSSGLDQFSVVRLQQHLTTLSESLSACDRILNTPIPLSYTRCGGGWTQPADACVLQQCFGLSEQQADGLVSGGCMGGCMGG